MVSPSSDELGTAARTRAERWVLSAGRRSQGRSGALLAAISLLLAALFLGLGVVRQSPESLLPAGFFLLMGALGFERRVFFRIVARQAAEIARLRSGGPASG